MTCDTVTGCAWVWGATSDDSKRSALYRSDDRQDRDAVERGETDELRTQEDTLSDQWANSGSDQQTSGAAAAVRRDTSPAGH